MSPNTPKNKQMSNINEIAAELSQCAVAEEDPVASCFDHFNEMSENMHSVIEQINQKCSRYTREPEPPAEICQDPNAETPLIAQLQDVNFAMAVHLRSLEYLRNRLV